MRVFITGASGWIGSASAAAIIADGHEVTGLARSDESAARLTAAGITPHRGSLDDLDSLRSGAEAADGVVHLGFNHDFSNMPAAWRTERSVVELYGDVLAGSDRPLVMASGLAGLVQGRAATEDDVNPNVGAESMRGGGERLALSFAERGVRSIAVRFAPTVHGEGDYGFTAELARIAVATGVAGYIGEGANGWSAVNRADAAALVATALQTAPAGSVVHAVGEQSVTTRAIAEALGASLGVPVVSIAPEDAAAHFGWIARFFGADATASSDLTQQRLGWTPTHQGLLADIAAGYYPGR